MSLTTIRFFGLAYAVYGWMPTVLKALPKDELINQLVGLVEDIRDESTPADFVLSKPEHRPALQAINSSVVGTSKFLHFCAPNRVPIWDSRIGRLFGCDNAYQMKKVDNFLEYVSVIHDFIRRGNFDIHGPLRQKFIDLDFESLSAVRQIELCLFLAGRPDER